MEVWKCGGDLSSAYPEIILRSLDFIFGSGMSRDPYKSLGCPRARPRSHSPKFEQRRLPMPDPLLSISTCFIYCLLLNLSSS